mmetsp:Transcript_20224/g.47518  ORF Transcript_20224/g.47518 Transcript_20224/m.47518 type:complete len:205 (-) Transcript_20224:655-1269(-)
MPPAPCSPIPCPRDSPAHPTYRTTGAPTCGSRTRTTVPETSASCTPWCRARSRPRSPRRSSADRPARRTSRPRPRSIPRSPTRAARSGRSGRRPPVRGSAGTRRRRSCRFRPPRRCVRTCDARRRPGCASWRIRSGRESFRLPPRTGRFRRSPSARGRRTVGRIPSPRRALSGSPCSCRCVGSARSRPVLRPCRMRPASASVAP